MFSFCAPLVQAGTNPIYNVKTQPDSSSSASVPVGVTSHQSSLSESPECRFFMNTGTCKYGDDCKYFHPKERMLISARPVSSLIFFFFFFFGNTNYSAFAVFRDNQLVVTSRPGSASTERTANLLTHCH